jgi:outer membrane protein, heavy metal efflux system
MAMPSRHLVLAALAGLTIPLGAAHAESVPMSATEFLTRVERAAPRIAALRARVGVAQAEVTAQRVRANPSLSYQREEVFADGQGLSDNFLSLSFGVDVSGRRSLRVAAAEVGVRAAQAEVGADVRTLLADAADRYHEAAYLRLRAELLRETRVQLVRGVDAVAARQKAGDVAGYDKDRIELELASHDDLLAEAESELAAARVALGRLAGEKAGVEPSDPLELPVIEPGDDLARIVAARLDHRAAVARAEQAEREAAAAGRAWIPDLSFTAGLKTSDVGDTTAIGYLAGLTVELPFFQRGQGDRARAVARRQEALAAVAAIDAETRGLAVEARELLERRVEQARRFAAEQLPRAATLVGSAETAYREGERPIFELLDAYRAARDVRLRELDLRREARRAANNLRRATRP